MTTWNPVNDTRIALSNSNLTATPTVAAGTGAGVLAVYGRKTGKAYFEVTTVLTSDNSYQYSNTIGVPVVPTKTSVLGLGLATQSQTQTVPGYNWGFYGSNTEEYDADGAPLSFTGNGWTGAGPKIGSVFNWVIGTNARIAAGARVTLRYGRPCNVYNIDDVFWHVDVCRGWCGGIVQSYNSATGAISVLIDNAQPELMGSNMEISFATSVDGDQNGFSSGLDTTPAYTIYPHIFGTSTNGNVALATQQGTLVTGFAIDYDARTMQVNQGDGFFTQMTGLPTDLLYPIFTSDLGPTVSATINFGASAFTYTPPAGYTAYDSTANPDPTLLPLRMTEEAVEVLRDSAQPVRASTMALAVLHDADALVRLSTIGVEVLRAVTDGVRVPRTHTNIIG